MARLAQPASREVIDTLAGVVDFYLWKGIPVARKWPRYRTTGWNPSELLRAHQFGAASKMGSDIDAEVRAAYDSMSAQTALTWKDWATRLYMSGDLWVGDPVP
jgi:hypothetical protein